MATAASTTLNPGHLKLELSVKGIRLDAVTLAQSGALRLPLPQDQAARGIDLVLPEDVWVSAPIDTGSAEVSPFLLSGSNDRFTLQRGGTVVDVRVVPQPDFYARTTSQGRPMWQVGMVYGGFIAINPGSACGYSVRGGPCRFCRSGSGVAIEQAFPMSVAEVVEVVQAAFAEGAVEFVYFNPSYVGTEDAGIAFLEPYIDAIKKHFNTLVAVQIHPPQQNRWIDRTYAMGVDALSYGIEINDHELLSRTCVGRVRHIGRERYFEALAHAATIFPSGTVWSDLILGVEAPTSTMSGIDTLVGMGVLPVLSVVRPSTGNGLASTPPDLESVAPICAHLFEAVRHAKINMNWVRDLSFAITPLEARFFAGNGAHTTVPLHQFYRSWIGTLAARSLSRLRRRLRVRTVGDSFDSSRL